MLFVEYADLVQAGVSRGDFRGYFKPCPLCREKYKSKMPGDHSTGQRGLNLKSGKGGKWIIECHHCSTEFIETKSGYFEMRLNDAFIPSGVLRGVLLSIGA